MTSIRDSLRMGLILCTVVAFAAAGLATDLVVDRALMNDLDRSLRERGRWVASTVELTEEGLELGFKEFELRDFEPARGASFLQLWGPAGEVLYRSAGLSAFQLAKPGGQGRDAFAMERAPDGRHLRTYRTRFIARVDPELDNPPPAPVVELALSRDLATIDALVRSLDVMILVIGLAAALLTLLVLRWVVRRSLSPMNRVAREIEGLGADDLSRRVATGDIPRELEPVVRRLNEMLDRLRAAFERERTFSADIAHELRTPLAGLRSSLEVELSQPRPTVRYEQALRESLSIALHMQDLVQTLFQLARLDAGLVDVEASATDLSELTQSSLEPLAPRAEARRIAIITSMETPTAVHSDPLLLSTAIRNLLDNAISHADEGGRIRVEVGLAGGTGRVRISNSGARTAQQDVPRLFDRFVRGDTARTSVGGHHGLGLALVRRIAETLRCHLDVRSEAGGEFVVILDVPRR